MLPNLNGTLIFAAAVPSLPTNGVQGLDNICLNAMPFSRAFVCDSVSGRNLSSLLTYQPALLPIFAFNAFLYGGADYSIIASSAQSLLSTGLRTDAGFAVNFTAFFDATAPIGVKNDEALQPHLAHATAFTGCNADGTAQASTCNGWTSNSSINLINMGKAYDLTSADLASNWLDDTLSHTCADVNKYVYCAWVPTASDGIQNGDETGVDCGGSTLFYDGSISYPCYVPPPTITCPGNITLPTAPGAAHAILKLPQSMTVSSLIRYTVSYSYESLGGGSAADGDLVEIVKSPVTIRATVTDGKGQTDSCLFSVIVVDVESPSIACPSMVTAGTDPGANYSISVTWPQPLAADNVAVVDWTRPDPQRRFPYGISTTTLYAYDAAGNSGNCTLYVRVFDQEPPIITYCPTDMTQYTDPGQQYGTVYYPQPSATDNIGLINSLGTVVAGPSNGTQVNVETMSGSRVVLVHYVFEDAAGNQTSCAFRITIIDNEPPTIGCPANLTTVTDFRSATVMLPLQTPTVTDNVNLTSFTTQPEFPVGLSRVTVTALDERGNMDQCHYTVTVYDVEPPVLICPPDLNVTLPAGLMVGPVTWIQPIVTDNVAVTNIASNYQSGDMFAWTESTLIIYVAEDAAGNQGTCNFSLSVFGSVNPPSPASALSDPSITCPVDQLRMATYASQPPSARITWSPPSIVNSRLLASVSGSALTRNNTLFTTGTHVLTYELRDSGGLLANCSFELSVRSFTPDPEMPAARGQISIVQITSDLLELQVSVITTLAQVLNIPVERVSVVSVTASFSSTDIVFEFVPLASSISSDGSAVTMASRASRNILALTVTEPGTDAQTLLAAFHEQLDDPSSPLRSSSLGQLMVPTTYVNCSSTYTAPGVVRVRHCPTSNTSFAAFTTCPPGCLPLGSCSRYVGQTSSSEWYETQWAAVVFTSLAWFILCLLAYFLHYLRFGPSGPAHEKLVSMDAPPVIPWPTVRAAAFMPLQNANRLEQLGKDVDVHEGTKSTPRSSHGPSLQHDENEDYMRD